MRLFYFASFDAVVAAIWTALILIPDLRMSRIISGGSVGTWFFVGYITFIVVGCAGILSCGTVHHILSTTKNKTPSSTLTWLGLIIWEVGLVGATWLLGLSGFIGGSDLLNGLPIPDIHNSIFVYALPIEIFAGIAILGFLISIINVYVAKKAA
ncbi:MAG: hypothetical protein HXX80_06670 [Nitrososphaerales archaeon]|nr:hypothetical protein [Nitrososphaerales archaeon]